MEEFYNRGLDDFKDSYPTTTFIRTINSLIDAMNWRTAQTVTSDKESHGQKVIIILTFMVNYFIILLFIDIWIIGNFIKQIQMIAWQIRLITVLLLH